MKKLLSALAFAGLGLGGCASVGTVTGPNTMMTGDSFYVKNVGMPLMTFSSHIYYCAAPSSGAAQCKEVTYVPAPAK